MWTYFNLINLVADRAKSPFKKVETIYLNILHIIIKMNNKIYFVALHLIDYN